MIRTLFKPDHGVTYIPKSEPWKQQLEAFELSKDREYFALFMEPRTGKSKVIIDTTAYQYEHGAIDGLLLISYPNGVHRNWITNEIPAHLPDRIPRCTFIWRTNKASRKYFQTAFEALCNFRGLAILSINAEALPFEVTRKAIGRFIKSRHGLIGVGDETIFMQNPGKKRTRVMMNIRKHLKFARILDGTPIGNIGPLGLYAPVGFLDKSILGFDNFTTYKNHYAIIEEQGDYVHRQAVQQGLIMAGDRGLTGPLAENFAHNYARRIGRSWLGLQKDEDGNTIYRNIDELQQRLIPHSYRCTFAECFDTPRKVHQSLYFELTDQQRSAYDELAEQYATEVQGVQLTATMVLTRYTRLQQITSNYWPSQKQGKECPACRGEGCNDCDGIGIIINDTGLMRIDPDHNPRLELLQQQLHKGDQWIIWARFRQEIEDILKMAENNGFSAVRYDGKTSLDNKGKAVDDFQAGKVQLFVAQEQSAQRGIPLWKARGMIYYSNMFSLPIRIQTGDRAEHPSRKRGTEILDLLAEETIDDQIIVPSLQANLSIARHILNFGNPFKGAP